MRWIRRILDWPVWPFCNAQRPASKRLPTDLSARPSGSEGSRKPATSRNRRQLYRPRNFFENLDLVNSTNNMMKNIFNWCDKHALFSPVYYLKGVPLKLRLHGWPKMICFYSFKTVFLSNKKGKKNTKFGCAGKIKSFRGPCFVHACFKGSKIVFTCCFLRSILSLKCKSLYFSCGSSVCWVKTGASCSTWSINDSISSKLESMQ